MGSLFGGGGGAAPPPTYQSPPPAQIPNDSNIQAAAIHRTQAGFPYLSSPWRTMDFLHGLGGQGIGAMQTPQFLPGQGQSQFNPAHGGGYTQGWDPGIYAQGQGAGGAGNPILGALGSLLGLQPGLDVVKGGENMAATGGPGGGQGGTGGQGNVQPKGGGQGMGSNYGQPAPQQQSPIPAPQQQGQGGPPQQQQHPSGVNIPPQYTPQGYQDMYGGAHPNPANLAAAQAQWQHAQNQSFGQAPYNSGSAGYTPGVGAGFPGAYPGSLGMPNAAAMPQGMTQQIPGMPRGPVISPFDLPNAGRQFG